MIPHYYIPPFSSTLHAVCRMLFAVSSQLLPQGGIGYTPVNQGSGPV